MAEINDNPQASENSEHSTTPPEQNTTNRKPENVTKEPPNKDARLWATLCHLAGLAGFAFPVGNVILPLIFWQLKKDQYPFVDEHGKEAVNFQISITLYALASFCLFIICIGPFLLSAVGILDLIFLTIAAIKANDGQRYLYPLTIRLIK